MFDLKKTRETVLMELDSFRLSIAPDDPVYARVVPDGDLDKSGAVSNRPGSGLIKVPDASFVGGAIEVIDGKPFAPVSFPSWNFRYSTAIGSVIPYRSPDNQRGK